jgi:hypothetical protein
MHAVSLLEEARSLNNSTYVMILEDDFPLCDSHSFRDVIDGLEQASAIRKDDGRPNCGVFFATGGSALALRRDTSLDLLINVLTAAIHEEPHDVVMQHCLLGDYPEW